MGVKPIRAWGGFRGFLCCGAPPQGLCKAPHGQQGVIRAMGLRVLLDLTSRQVSLYGLDPPQVWGIQDFKSNPVKRYHEDPGTIPSPFELNNGLE